MGRKVFEIREIPVASKLNVQRCSKKVLSSIEDNFARVPALTMASADSGAIASGFLSIADLGVYLSQR